jgi:hypothetical protein
MALPPEAAVVWFCKTGTAPAPIFALSIAGSQPIVI